MHQASLSRTIKGSIDQQYSGSTYGEPPNCGPMQRTPEAISLMLSASGSKPCMQNGKDQNLYAIDYSRPFLSPISFGHFLDRVAQVIDLGCTPDTVAAHRGQPSSVQGGCAVRRSPWRQRRRRRRRRYASSLLLTSPTLDCSGNAYIAWRLVSKDWIHQLVWLF